MSVRVALQGGTLSEAAGGEEEGLGCRGCVVWRTSPIQMEGGRRCGLGSRGPKARGSAV